MRFPSKEIVDKVKREYPAGTRVKLVQMDDPQAPPVGTCGTVTGVDDTGSILMNWDNGCGLNVVYGEDRVEKLQPDEESRKAEKEEKHKDVACPICGALPKIHDLYAVSDRRPGSRPDDWNEYKVSCPNHHLDCGDWKKSKMEAWKDWLKRRKDIHQPDFCFNDNAFTIKQMTDVELAAFLRKWIKESASIMCKDLANGCALECCHKEENNGEFPCTPTQGNIMKWLQKPVDGIYPRGYPGVPEVQQNKDADVFEYRKRQAKCKI